MYLPTSANEMRWILESSGSSATVALRKRLLCCSRRLAASLLGLIVSMCPMLLGADAHALCRVSASVLSVAAPPAPGPLETFEDYRGTVEEPMLCEPPALRSMEAYKTRRSFLNGKVGFDVSSYSTDEAQQAQVQHLARSLDLTDATVGSCQQSASPQLSEAGSAASISSHSLDQDDSWSDTDEEDDIF